MSKEKVLVFNNGMTPRLLTNPSAELLASFPENQIVMKPKLNRFKGIPIQNLVLENGVIRKADKEELKLIESILQKVNTQAIENGRNKAMESYKKEVERKMKEILNIVEDQELTLIEYQKEILKLNKAKLWKLLAILSILVNCAALVVAIEPSLLDLIK